MPDTLENIIYRCIERFMASRFTERHGIVTSYDPDKHLAKVRLMPEGQETGWLPIETGHIGNGYGIATGLTPGNAGMQNSSGGQGGGGGGGGQGGQGGQDQQDNSGDQVVVRYQEGDFEGGKIVQRVHSDQDKPPRVASGESVIWTKWGQQIYFHQDGHITMIDGKGGHFRADGGGQVVARANDDDKDSCAAAKDHTHIRFGDMRVWVDKSGCWSSVPIQIANCSDSFKNG